METLEAILGSGTSEVDSGLVKEGSSSPQTGSGRNSPPPNCAICLGTCHNKSFTDSCLHQFCFTCLLTWSKVKAECPLCKQNFKSIIHNVRSNHQYEEYRIETTTLEDDTDALSDSQEYRDTRRFRYSTTLTLPRRDSLVIQRLLMRYPLFDMMLPGAGASMPGAVGAAVPGAVPVGPPPQRSGRPPQARSFRRLVYRNNMWARPMPDFTNRLRTCTPEFYRENEGQLHRLVPWVARELGYLLNDNAQHVQYVTDVLLHQLRYLPITSERMRAALQPYLAERTHHFLHELSVFASSPYDLQGYDRHVDYTVGGPPATATTADREPDIAELSSETGSDSDRDVLMVEYPRRAGCRLRPWTSLAVDVHAPSTSAGRPGRAPPAAATPPAPLAALRDCGVIPIETISHSDTEDSASEVVFTGYIKPPQDRTPELVDLLASDSDVVYQESSPPAPGHAAGAEPEPAAAHPGPLVKLILKRHRESRAGAGAAGDCDGDEPDSDGSWFLPKSHAKRRARAASYDSATTVDTRRSTPSPPLLSGSERDEPSTSRPRTQTRKKTKKRSRKYKSSKTRKSRDERKSKKSKSHSSEKHKEKKKKKSKSRASRDVKSSRRTRSTQYCESTDEEQSPSTSTASHRRRKDWACGRSARSSSDRSRSSASATRAAAAATRHFAAYGSGSDSGSARDHSGDGRAPDVAHTLSTSAPPAPPHTPPTPAPQSSDSEDNLPLNLAVQKLRE